MSKSLQDQLLKAGLVGKDKAQKVKKQQQKQKKQQKKSKEETVDETKLQIQQAKLEQQEKDRKLNEARMQEAEKKAIAAQIKQLIEMNAISTVGGEVEHRFSFDSKIKKIYVTEKVRDELLKSRVAIVKNGERFQVVPKPVADKIAERDASVVIGLSEGESKPDTDDDYYAQFEIPDDLMW